MACHSQLQGATPPAPVPVLAEMTTSPNCGWSMPLISHYQVNITADYLHSASKGAKDHLQAPRFKSWSHLDLGTIPAFVASPVFTSPSCKIVILCPVASKKPHLQVAYKPNSYQLQQMKEEMQCLNIDWRQCFKNKRWQRFLSRFWCSANPVLTEQFQQAFRFFSLSGLFLLYFSVSEAR